MCQRSTLLFLSVVTMSACSDDDKSTLSADAGLAPIDCFQSPTTYLEILNACTDAEKVIKNSSLPLLMVDGGLPPLP